MASYLEWLRENIAVREIGEWVQISTPFLDRHNDFMQIYVKAEDGGFLLSDDGYVLEDLAASGCDVDSPRRREMLESLLRGFGAHVDNGEIIMRATKETFAQRKHALLQAMLGVNDLFLTSRSSVQGLFWEEVAQFLVSQQIRFVHSVQIAGRSGLPHTFDYVIPAWNNAPERILKSINNPSKEKVQSILFAWTDIREVRKGSQFFVVVNDLERSMSSKLRDACEAEGVQVVPWSQRMEYAATLSA